MPEGAFEMLAGTVLVGWALSRGFLPVPVAPGEVPTPDVSLYIAHPILAALITVVAIVVAVVAYRWVRRRFTGFVGRVRQGLAIFASPRQFVLGVASWQALGRVIRLGGCSASSRPSGSRSRSRRRCW